MSSHHHVGNTLADKVLEHTDVSVARCYQCGKCSAGCPVSEEMDFPPSMVLRMLQYGTPAMDEKVLGSYSIWLCLTCEMCISRCPMEVEIPHMMDYLRSESMKQGKENPRAKNIVQFHKAFLQSIEQTGRLYEMGLVVSYKMRTMNLMQDVTLAPSMYMKGKLALLPEIIKDKANIKRIFSKTINQK